MPNEIDFDECSLRLWNLIEGNPSIDEDLWWFPKLAVDEIDRLRSLIAAWADAEDTVENDFQFRDWEALDRGDDERELEAARAALRKAVGR